MFFIPEYLIPSEYLILRVQCTLRSICMICIYSEVDSTCTGSVESKHTVSHTEVFTRYIPRGNNSTAIFNIYIIYNGGHEEIYRYLYRTSSSGVGHATPTKAAAATVPSSPRRVCHIFIIVEHNFYARTCSSSIVVVFSRLRSCPYHRKPVLITTLFRREYSRAWTAMSSSTAAGMGSFLSQRVLVTCWHNQAQHHHPKVRCELRDDTVTVLWQHNPEQYCSIKVGARFSQHWPSARSLASTVLVLDE